jgi:putative flippase GtrA
MVDWLRKYLDKVPLIKQFIKFCLVGGTAAAIHFFILYSFTEWLGIWYVASSVCGFIISAIFNFSANKFWTFRNSAKGRAAAGQLARFVLVLVSGLIINTLIIYSITEFFGLDYRLSWVLATGIVMFWNFGFNRLWTFKHHSVGLPN